MHAWEEGHPHGMCGPAPSALRCAALCHAVVQIVLNYASFLQEHKFWEDSFMWGREGRPAQAGGVRG